MRSDPANELKRATAGADRLARWGRPLVSLGGGLFVVSLALPSIASIPPAEQLPAWVGYFDVGLAIVLVLVAFRIDAVTRGKIASPITLASYRFYRGAAILPLILLVGFFLVGEQIKWNVLLPGLAWRTWLLFYSVPAVLAVWESSRRQRAPG